MTRPLLIGQAPGPTTNPDAPLWPRPKQSGGGRLWALTGMTSREYLDTFDRMNLLYKFHGRHKRDDKFPRALGRVAAEAIRPLLLGRTVILVGRNVARAFGHEDAPWHEWDYCPEWRYHFVVIPHPSGRNHWYNRPENREASAAFWAQFRSHGSVAFLPRVRHHQLRQIAR